MCVCVVHKRVCLLVDSGVLASRFCTHISLSVLVSFASCPPHFPLSGGWGCVLCVCVWKPARLVIFSLSIYAYSSHVSSHASSSFSSFLLLLLVMACLALVSYKYKGWVKAQFFSSFPHISLILMFLVSSCFYALNSGRPREGRAGARGGRRRRRRGGRGLAGSSSPFVCLCVCGGGGGGGRAGGRGGGRGGGGGGAQGALWRRQELDELLIGSGWRKGGREGGGVSKA